MLLLIVYQCTWCTTRKDVRGWRGAVSSFLIPLHGLQESNSQITRPAWHEPLSAEPAPWPQIWALKNGVWGKTGSGVSGKMRLTHSETAQAWSKCAGGLGWGELLLVAVSEEHWPLWLEGNLGPA